MSALLLINGPPAAGKSTVARLLAQRRPNTQVVDPDVLRTDLPDWRADPRSANLVARERALSAVVSALADGRDVVVPQLLARHEYPELLYRAACAADARWFEVLLDVDAEVMVSRFAARTAAATRVEHSAAAWQVDRDGGPESLRQWISRLDAYRDGVFGAGRELTVIETTHVTPEVVVDALVDLLDG